MAIWNRNYPSLEEQERAKQIVQDAYDRWPGMSMTTCGFGKERPMGEEDALQLAEFIDAMGRETERRQGV